jgi:hypothetical protein
MQMFCLVKEIKNTGNKIIIIRMGGVCEHLNILGLFFLGFRGAGGGEVSGGGTHYM